MGGIDFLTLCPLDGLDLDDSNDRDRDYKERDTSYMRSNLYLDYRLLQRRAMTAAASGCHRQEKAKLTDDQLLLCRHQVRGFSLTAKKWCEFCLLPSRWMFTD
jgi:hypothetical protein